MDKDQRIDWIVNCGVIGILRASSPDGLVEATEAMILGGVTVVEFALNTPEAFFLIKTSRVRFGSRALIGAGTVLTRADAQESVDAGAQFIITPVLNAEVVEFAHGQGIPVIPGAYSPTEIRTAFEWGADFIKLFPASVGGPDYVKAIRGPFPEVQLVPTGGVSVENAGDFIRAGAAAVAVGGKLASRDWIAAKRFTELSETARQLSRVIITAREADNP
jgi:2-dehydro-3-deoxyphosphogluconate aldolase/(4S)-4-hydroxy-2-oxoglutarate aldolase